MQLRSKPSAPWSEAEVGDRIRRLRQARRLTLRAIAERAGISESHLSLLERGHANASIATLRRIALALNLTMAALFDDELVSDGPRVLRREDRPHIALGMLGRKYHLTPSATRKLDVYVGDFDPGGSTGEEAYTHGDSEELLLVVRGRMRLDLGGESIVLREGDSMVYRSSVPHRLTEIGGETAQALWAMTPPSY